MLNLKNNENKIRWNLQKKTKVKLKFEKIKGTFLDSIPWLKSNQYIKCK